MLYSIDHDGSSDEAEKYLVMPYKLNRYETHPGVEVFFFCPAPAAVSFQGGESGMRSHVPMPTHEEECNAYIMLTSDPAAVSISIDAFHLIWEMEVAKV